MSRLALRRRKSPLTDDTGILFRGVLGFVLQCLRAYLHGKSDGRS